MKNKTLPIFIGTALLALLALLSDFTPLMPPLAGMMTLLAVTVLMCVFAGFVMQENGGDERELVHRMSAGRIAYLSGIGALTIALVVEGFAHAIDPWILITLGIMVISKVTARLYFDKYR